MSPRAAGKLTFAFLIVMTAAVTWPGVTYFNRIEPRVFGIPFNFAWVAGWIVLAFVVLLLLERTVSNAEKRDEQKNRGER